jgi:hypothetical protein
MGTDTAELEAIAVREWTHPRTALQAIADPAVTTGFTIVTPGTVEQILQALTFTLVTDSNVANRIMVVKFLDPTGVSFAEIASPFTQAASLTSVYTFATGIQSFGANGAANIGVPLPALRLDVSMSVSVSITAKAAGDQVSKIRAAWSRWPTRPPLHF